MIAWGYNESKWMGFGSVLKNLLKFCELNHNWNIFRQKIQNSLENTQNLSNQMIFSSQ